MIADATKLYWPVLNGGSTKSALLAGGAPTVIDFSLGANAVHIAIDTTSIFFTSPDVGGVFGAPFAGDAGAPTRLASGSTGLYGVAVDSTSVYWTEKTDGNL